VVENPEFSYPRDRQWERSSARCMDLGAQVWLPAWCGEFVYIYILYTHKHERAHTHIHIHIHIYIHTHSHSNTNTHTHTHTHTHKHTHTHALTPCSWRAITALSPGLPCPRAHTHPRRLGSGGAGSVMVSEAAANAKGGQASMVENIKKGRQEKLKTRNTEHTSRDHDDTTTDVHHNKQAVSRLHLCAPCTPPHGAVDCTLTWPACTVLPPYCSGG